jgi:hypothetical protein
MLENVPNEILKSLASLKNDKRFEDFIVFINDQSLKLAVSSTKLKDETICRWQQGASQVLYELIEQITESRETLEKIDKAGRNKNNLT